MEGQKLCTGNSKQKVWWVTPKTLLLSLCSKQVQLVQGKIIPRSTCKCNQTVGAIWGLCFFLVDEGTPSLRISCPFGNLRTVKAHTPCGPPTSHSHHSLSLSLSLSHLQLNSFFFLPFINFGAQRIASSVIQF
ncbi:hypothetical protein QN277_012231 [Acacia crassicarpa]|uniref:Uncharacterized protein n=1 Tax=Acacia crassicarpa TaxID=499986 RepID=A0AAE1N0B8_9FABA|nr:hypothetical protein QN277_012231 [Acacia crassicarpa]